MGHKTTEKTLDRVVGSDTRDDQFGWTFCLAELAKVTVELVPEVVAFSWPIIASRIPRVQPEESGTKSTYPYSIHLVCFYLFLIICYYADDRTRDVARLVA